MIDLGIRVAHVGENWTGLSELVHVEGIKCIPARLRSINVFWKLQKYSRNILALANKYWRAL